MKVILNIKALIASIAAFTVAYTTATGAIDNYIHFAGEANAMAFFMVAGVMGVCSLAASFETVKK